MMTHYLQTRLTFTCDNSEDNTDEAFDAFADAVQEQLDLSAQLDEGFIDPDLTVGIRDRWVEFLIGIEADTLNDAIRLFQANLRTALHAAGCGTPDRPAFKPTTQTPEVHKAEVSV
jgi:hypothetical protein